MVMEKSRVFFYIGPWLGAAVGSIAGGSILHGAEWMSEGASSFLSTLLYDLIKDSRLVENIFEYTTAGSVRAMLDESIYLSKDEDLLSWKNTSN